jgi:hypothetical protein
VASTEIPSGQLVRTERKRSSKATVTPAFGTALALEGWIITFHDRVKTAMRSVLLTGGPRVRLHSGLEASPSRARARRRCEVALSCCRGVEPKSEPAPAERRCELRRLSLMVMNSDRRCRLPLSAGVQWGREETLARSPSWSAPCESRRNRTWKRDIVAGQRLRERTRNAHTRHR